MSVGYRLAPEHPHPAGPDDGVAVLRWLLEHGAAEFGSERIVIGGESAGGFMAAAVLLRVRDELDAIERVDGANLVFGVYDWGRSPSQRGIRVSEIADILDVGGIEFFTECYLPGMSADERRHPSNSPAFADLHDLPPALMTVGTADHLLDDTLMLASRWAAAGNDVELLVLPDMPHGFMAFPCAMTAWWADRTRAWFAEVLARRTRDHGQLRGGGCAACSRRSRMWAACTAALQWRTSIGHVRAMYPTIASSESPWWRSASAASTGATSRVMTFLSAPTPPPGAENNAAPL